MKIHYLILFCSFLYISCSSNKTEKIIFKETNIGVEIGRLKNFKVRDNYFIAVGNNYDDTQIILSNMKSRETVRWGKTGQGPEEFLSAWNILLDGKHIGIFDVRKKVIAQYAIAEDTVPLFQHEVKIMEPHLLEIERLKSDIYVGLGLFNHKFALINSNGETITYGGILPPKQSVEILDFIHAAANQGIITTTNNKFAIATRYAEDISFYTWENGKVEEIKCIHESDVKYKQIGDSQNNSFLFTSGAEWGYLSITSDEDFVYALYSGNLIDKQNSYFASKIQMFDWNGRKIKDLIFTNRISHIYIDNSTLYGYDVDKEDIVYVELNHNI